MLCAAWKADEMDDEQIQELLDASDATEAAWRALISRQLESAKRQREEAEGRYPEAWAISDRNVHRLEGLLLSAADNHARKREIIESLRAPDETAGSTPVESIPEAVRRH